MKENTFALLRSNGWMPNRHMEDQKIITELIRRGYHTILNSFKEFYGEFGELIIKCDVEGYPRSFAFYPGLVPEFDDSLIREEYPKITNSELLNPLGTINGEINLVIDEGKIIYSLYHNHVQVIGETIEKALDNLCNKPWSEFNQLVTPDDWG